MQQGAIAVLLVIALTGCANSSFLNLDEGSLHQWLFQRSSPPQTDARQQTPDSKADTSTAAMVVSKPQATVAVAEDSAPDGATDAAEHAADRSSQHSSEHFSEQQQEAPVIDAVPKASSPDSAGPTPESAPLAAASPEPVADPEATNPASSAREPSTDQPPAEAATQVTAQPEPEPEPAHEDAESKVPANGASLARVVIPYANTPFAHLSPQQHPPLSHQEYQQIQRVLYQRQQNGEDIGRYREEIARGRSEGGVMAWFYRLWLL